MQSTFPNKLINETSPYLLQHAYNPVHWYPWGSEALQKAKDEDKVILVSIGYAACHWCHVMERESFEDEATAAVMNKNFINIKIDREERPDLDHIYMDAVQAMTGSGGWPLNVFLTPGAKPFYGGTYFPPVKAFNRASWTEVLNGVERSWQERRDEIETQAGSLTEHLHKSNSFGQQLVHIPAAEMYTREQCATMFANIMKNADTSWGGFGNAPKFPQTFTIQYLLQYHYYTNEPAALQQALLSIDKMLQGGIYDHVGGGLSRYSTDAEWLAPHFEKMLYDNTYLLSILCDAFLITRNEGYAKAIRHSITFLQREMLDANGGFYAALDADSEGEEGKFYIWQKAEIEEVLGGDAELFCTFYDVTPLGNWEEKNILRILQPAAAFAQDRGLEPAAFESLMDTCLQKLLAKRNERIRPATDDKLLLGWNALMVTALCKAAAALKDDRYKQLAVDTMAFLLTTFSEKGSPAFLHTYKQGVAKYPAFLDDYAYLVQALIQLQEITSDTTYLNTASNITGYVIEHFGDEDTGFFYFTHAQQADVILRKKEVYDGATASGNSIMAENLVYLATVFDNKTWHARADQMMQALAAAVVKYPGSFAVWGTNIARQAFGIHEIAVTGGNFAAKRDQLLQHYLPAKVLMCGNKADKNYPLLAGKQALKDAVIYLCSHYACQKPEVSVEKIVLMAKKQAN